MKNLLDKKIIKDMPLLDKAKLIIADHVLKIDSDGKKRLLTGEEEKKMLDEIVNAGETTSLNTIVELYNLYMLATAEVRLKNLNLELTISRLETIVLSIINRESSIDTLSELSKLSKKVKIDEIRHDITSIQASITKIPDQFSLFEPPEDQGKNFEEKLAYYQSREPNICFQKSFLEAFNACRQLKCALFVIETIEKKAGYSLLGDTDRAHVDEGKANVELFTSLTGFCSFFEMYKTAYEMNLSRKSNFSVMGFGEIISDFTGTLQISESEKNSLLERLFDLDVIKKHGWSPHPIT